MSMNTRYILKAICDAVDPNDNNGVPVQYSPIIVKNYEECRNNVEKLIFDAYSDYIDEIAKSINMRLKPKPLYNRIISFLSKKETKIARDLMSHLIWYGMLCRMLSTFYLQGNASIEYLPFEV